MKTKINSAPLSVTDYTRDPEILKCIAELKGQFGNNFENLLVSDTLDGNNHQYVNLVQKGGGVLGVALVGYTYILESAGIRFLRLAGTSAGAINTAMLAVIGKKEEAKSEKVLEYMCGLNFFKLVDGHPFACWLIRKFIQDNKFKSKLKRFLFGVCGSFFLCIFADILFLGLSRHFYWCTIAGRISFMLTGFIIFIIITTILYVKLLLTRLKNNGFGINPGIYFYKWVKDIMESNGVKTVSDLNNKAGATVAGLKVRNPATQDVTTLKADITLITSELVTENKIEFPAMCDLFRADPDELHPAEFVRASMSIPIFFESHIINNIPVENDNVIKAWKARFRKETGIPSCARFVDGGMLSNFPINIFYNPKIIEPRLPSFGVDLDDSEPLSPEEKNAATWSIGGYMGRMFNTIRYYYDKDFLIKNAVFEKGIGVIKLSEYNWLNFFLSDQEKKDMFIKGAQAAKEFLIRFDWKSYQQERTAMQIRLNEENKAEPISENKFK